MNGNEPAGTPLAIGEIARRAGVSVDTVRHYESRGLIPAAERTASGYRKFRPEVVRRILEVRAAVELGFSLDELARAVAARERGAPPCRTVRELLVVKRVELDRRIEELVARRTRVDATLTRWDRKLAATRPDRPAHLLSELVPESPPSRPKSIRSTSRRTCDTRLQRKGTR